MNTNRLINTFLEAVQIDSPTGHEGNMVKWVSQKISKFGCSSTTDKYGNIIAKTLALGTPIILTAHLDTVEPGRNIKPRIEDGIIRSSGDTILGADDKVAVSVILEVLETLNEQKLSIPLEVIFTLSEEVGNLGAANMDYSLISGKNGFAFDTVGPIGQIVTASPFYNRFDIEIVGKAAHASKPDKAVNAIRIFSNSLNKIKLGKLDEDTLCNIGVIKGGSVRNTIPGNVFIEGEVRSFVEDKMMVATKNIIDVFSEEVKDLRGRIKCEVVRENGGYKLNDSDPAIKKIARVMKDMGIKPIFKKNFGCADSNIFFDHDIQVINISDGSEKSHTIEENISVENLTKLCELALSLVK